MSGLNKLAKEIHDAASDKGFWDKPREKGTLLMLCVSELSEAMEADRKDRFADLAKYDKGVSTGNVFEDYVKDTFEDELADTIIRILDMCGAYGIDIERHIKLKMEYNETRERMHGKRY